MTRNDSAPDTGLPKFPVNVAPTDQITQTHLSSLVAGQRLGRPVGFTLAELAAQREPIVSSSRARQRSIGSFDAPPPNEPDLQFD